MESQKPRIEIYVKRPFGEKINASFDFIKENGKLIMKYITYLLLPLSLLQALSLNGFMSSYLGVGGGAANMNGSTDGILSALPMLITSYSTLMLCYWVGGILLTSLIYALLQTYSKREGRLQGITLTELKPLLLHNVVAMIKLSLFTTLLVLVVLGVIAGLAFLTPFTLILTIPLLFVLVVQFSLLLPVYLFEGISLVATLKKAFRLGFATWGGIFAILLMMSLIGSILQGVLGTPWSVALMVKNIFTLSEGGDAVGSSLGYNFALYLFAVLQCYGIYLGSVFVVLGTAFQYGHASEVVDSISVEDDIDRFEQL